MDKIIIRDLIARGIIGVNEWERTQPQEIRINIEIITDTRKAAVSDDFSKSVDYSRIALEARKIAESVNRFSVEALAHDLAEMCLKEPLTQKVMVRVEKPSILPFCEAVGVEIVRTRKQILTG